MNRRKKLLLCAGWILLGAGVLIAHQNPAQGYELSIYGGTPVEFWITVALALVIAVVTVLSPERRTAVVGGSMGIAAMSAILFLPHIRGYYYLGVADSVSHLGYARDLVFGQASVSDLPYPGLHLFGTVITYVTGMGIETGLHLAIFSIMATFLLSVPILVRELSPSPVAARYALLAALLLLPINGVSVHPRTHPFTAMVFFTPFFLYAMVRVKQHLRLEWLLVLFLISVGFVAYHVQVAIAVGLFALIVGGITHLTPRLGPAAFDSVYGSRQLLLISLSLLILSVTHVLDPLIRILSSLIFRLFVQPQSSVEDRSMAAAEIGADPTVLVLRISGPAIVFGLLALATVLHWLSRRDRPWVGYFAAGSVAFAGIGGLFVVSGQINQFTRYGSLLLVIVTILASIGLTVVDGWSRPRFGASIVHKVVVLGFCVLLVASVPAIFIGPYTERPNQHISEGMYDGTETVFEYDDGSTPYYGVNIHRFDDAIYGLSNEQIRNEDRIRGEMAYEFSPYTLTMTAEDRYLLLTNYQYEQDVILHNGVRNSESDYEGLEYSPSIQRVLSNDEVTLYRSTPE